MVRFGIDGLPLPDSVGVGVEVEVEGEPDTPVLTAPGATAAQPPMNTAVTSTTPIEVHPLLRTPPRRSLRATGLQVADIWVSR